ncbi:FERM central domain protein, partial [Ancylostoma duodenale]
MLVLYELMSRSQQIRLPWEFCFEVKFYPTIPSSLNDDHARYNLFLQLKHDVSTGRLPATIETHAILGSLVAQAEFGDAKPTAEYEQYLRTTKFAPQNSDQLIEMIAQKHKEHKGLTPAEAENLYMDTCKQQTMYGIFVFNAKDNKNVPVGIGVCAHGIYIYKEQIRVNRFPWQGIIKICYRKAQFAIKLKAGEIDKKEATVTYKVADYEHAKRIWKCAVEHHTFFRLIQPDEKPKSSLFRWGSARFRYQGRTQFQTKMASQMFDKPHQTAVQRFDSARLTHSLDNVAREQAPSGHVSPLHYADNELGAREPMASPAVSYEVSGQNEKRKLDDKVGNGLPSDDDELVYTPVESPSSAAYYLSERSSACSPNSNDFVFSQQMRSATTPYSWRTNDRDQSSSAASGGVYYPCTESIKGSRSLPQQASASTHSAIDSIEKRAEMEQRPINDSVHVYHPGNYQNLRHQPRPVNLFNNDVNNQRNGVTAVRRLGPDNEMDRHPIRYFVDVQHSGASQIPRVSRVRHPGKEEIGPAVLSNYSFSKSSDTSVAVQRLEPQRDLTCHNIRQYSSVYHPGSSQISASKSLEDDSPTVRLVTRVQPASLPQERSQPFSLPRERSQPASNNNGALEVSSRLEEPYDSKHNGESSSGILKFWKVKDRKHGEKKKRDFKTENESEQYGESKAFVGRTAVITTGTKHIEEKGHQVKAAVTSHPSTSDSSHLKGENGSERAYTSTAEISYRRGHLFGRWRHEGDEETVEKDRVRPETYGVASTSYAGPLESTARQSELQSAPLRDYAQAYHHGQSWDAGKGVKTPITH